MNINKSLSIILLLFDFNCFEIAGQEAKFRYYLSFDYSYGLRENSKEWTLTSNNSNMRSYSLYFKGLYFLNDHLALGAGLGADALRKPQYTTFPVYTAVHFYPLTNRKFFVYSYIGYGLNTKISNPGLHFEVGTGYQWMFRKHFGLGINAGYNLKQMRVEYIDEDQNHSEMLFHTRHSLSAGLSIIF